MFCTTKETCLREKQSLLAKLLNTEMVEKDEQGAYFFDRSHFELFATPNFWARHFGTNSSIASRMLDDAKYFGITSLTQVLQRTFTYVVQNGMYIWNMFTGEQIALIAFASRISKAQSNASGTFVSFGKCIQVYCSKTGKLYHALQHHSTVESFCIINNVVNFWHGKTYISQIYASVCCVDTFILEVQNSMQRLPRYAIWQFHKIKLSYMPVMPKRTWQHTKAYLCAIKSYAKQLWSTTGFCTVNFNLF